MDDEFILNDLIELLDINRPAIISCCRFSLTQDIKHEESESLMRKAHKESQNVEDKSERMNVVYSVRGYMKHGDQRVLGCKLVNEADVEKTKSSFEEVLVSSLFGIYKGLPIDVKRLRIHKDSVPVVRVVIPENATKSGNALRQENPYVKPDQSSTASITKPAAVKPKIEVKSVPKPPTASTSKPTNKKIVSNKKTNKTSASTMKQPVLGFKRNDHAPEIRDKSQERNNGPDQNSKEESPGKSSDKENKTSEETKPKRNRVRIASESDSDEETLEVSKPEIQKDKGRTMLLDPEDCQMESDEDTDEKIKKKAVKKKRSSEPNSEEKPKRKKKKADETVDNQEEDDGKPSKISQISQPVYGKVKTGAKCTKMKTVDKTYTDEDGFMVTTKVEVEDPDAVIDSEPEVIKPQETKSAESVPAVQHKKKSKPAPANQSSLLSFFKKK